MTAPSNLGIAPHEPESTIPDENDTPVKKVTITDRDDAYLATLLRNDPGIVGIDLDDIQLEGGGIFGFTPPVPTSTREWLLLGLAAKLHVIEKLASNHGASSLSSVDGPFKLDSSADLADVINKVNDIIDKLGTAGVFRLGK